MGQFTKFMNKFVTTSTNNPSINLALEEAFFKDNTADVIVFLWQNKDTIVIGNNQNSFLEFNIEACKKDNVKNGLNVFGAPITSSVSFNLFKA